jgi:protein-S-isoprenylcysteine O-methyltransferase Ste14
MLLFLILLVVIILDGILIMLYFIKKDNNKKIVYFGSVIYLIALFSLPFFDPFKLPGFLASVILMKANPSIFGFFLGIFVINCAIYGIHIFLSSMNLLTAERYKKGLITTGQFNKRRFPIYTSYHILGLSYFILMGSITGTIIISITMIFLDKETKRKELDNLIPKFGEIYLNYQKMVKKRIYSNEILIILLLEYGLFLLALYFAYFYI